MSFPFFPYVLGMYKLRTGSLNYPRLEPAPACKPRLD